MKVDEEAAFHAAVKDVRKGLVALATDYGARFEDLSESDDKAPEAPPYWFRLMPARAGAAAVDVMPDNARSTYIDVGLHGWIEVFTSPKDSRGVDDILQIVRTLAEGTIKERVWRRKRDGKSVDSVLYLQWKADQKWHLIGEVSRPLPFFRNFYLTEETIEYAPYQ